MSIFQYEIMCSAEPDEILKHYSKEFKNNEIEECCVARLKNGKYLYYSFSGIKNEETGVLDFEELDKEEEAVKLYEQFCGPW